MRFAVKKRNKRVVTATPKQTMVLMPVLFLGVTLIFGFAITSNSQLLIDHEIVQATVTDTRRVAGGRRTGSKTQVDVNYRFEGTVYRGHYKQKRSKAIPEVGGTVSVAARPGHSSRIESAVEGWYGRLASETILMVLALLVFDAAFVAAFRDARRRLKTG